MMRLLVIVLSLALLAAPAPAARYQARARRALSGDTLEVERAGKLALVRLAGIAAPRPGQPFGEESRRVLEAAALGQTLDVQEKIAGEDGVMRAVVLTGEGANLGASLVASGWAWRDPAATAGRVEEALEQKAREAKKGLWSGPAPTPPWRWDALRARARATFGEFESMRSEERSERTRAAADELARQAEGSVQWGTGDLAGAAVAERRQRDQQARRQTIREFSPKPAASIAAPPADGIDRSSLSYQRMKALARTDGSIEAQFNAMERGDWDEVDRLARQADTDRLNGSLERIGDALTRMNTYNYLYR
jgi:endonuclease YncB( thermonuclease family)